MTLEVSFESKFFWSENLVLLNPQISNQSPRQTSNAVSRFETLYLFALFVQIVKMLDVSLASSIALYT